LRPSAFAEFSKIVALFDQTYYLVKHSHGIVRSLTTAGAIVATLEQIQARLKKLQAQADAIVAKQSSTVLETIRRLMDKHGLTIADIDAHVGCKKRGPKVDANVGVKTAKSEAKYRDPKSGATWSGHGRAPGWIANVKDRSRFLVDRVGTSAAAAPATKGLTTGNYVRGPQPAKYRDPKSGATWSGRGRAPEWLASAKDRSRFLIEGEGAVASEPTSASKASKPKFVGKGGAVAKKAATKKTAATKSPAFKKAASEKGPAVKTTAAEPPAVPKSPAEVSA
jgi:DNA-binding protein H-NS